ncbi:MAG TPA: hypothetical protein VM802_01410 [Chitinophaga sp.]|uniref:hypothetical protein n=1 Tax=Chitinophaga sp. TaxID=1869181 RepID=UPI002CE1CF6E|nr:hypothetical protein [Chitinophaga sp.]HVI43489.1 hypothetical protein [Chitinophaga sp.]
MKTIKPILPLFLLMITFIQAFSQSNKEEQRLIKLISKNLEYPKQFREQKKSTTFSLRFKLSTNSKLEQVTASKLASSDLVSHIVDKKNYETIQWAEIAKQGNVLNNVIIVVLTITPGDNIPGLNNFTQKDVNSLFIYSGLNESGSSCYLLQPISLQYYDAVK